MPTGTGRRLFVCVADPSPFASDLESSFARLCASGEGRGVLRMVCREERLSLPMRWLLTRPRFFNLEELASTSCLNGTHRFSWSSRLKHPLLGGCVSGTRLPSVRQRGFTTDAGSINPEVGVGVGVFRSCRCSSRGHVPCQLGTYQSRGGDPLSQGGMAVSAAHAVGSPVGRCSVCV